MALRILPDSKKYNAPEKILILSFLFLGVNVAINLFNHFFRGLHYPFNTFLYEPGDRFADFLKFIDALHVAKTWNNYNPYLQYGRIYGIPFLTTIYYLFGWLILLAGNKYVVLFGFYAASLFAFGVTARKIGNSLLVILLAILTYPMLMELDRGNMAILVFLFVLIALYTDNILIATLGIAIATSIKVTPIIFIAPLLLTGPVSFKRIGKIGLCLLGWLVIINYASLVIIQKAISNGEVDSFSFFFNLMSTYSKEAVADMVGLSYGSALYPPMAFVASKLHVLDSFMRYVKPLLLPVLVFGIAGWALLIKHNLGNTVRQCLQKEKMVFVLCMCFVLFMPVTGDYYLLIMLVPLILYPKSRYTLAYCIVYALLLAPKNFIYPFEIKGRYISLQVFINPLLLLSLLFAELNLIPFMRRTSAETIEDDSTLELNESIAK